MLIGEALVLNANCGLLACISSEDVGALRQAISMADLASSASWSESTVKELVESEVTGWFDAVEAGLVWHRCKC